jgi:hypothetical protein
MFDSRQEQRFFSYHSVHTGTCVHPIPLLPGFKQWGREAEYTSLSNVWVKNAWSYTFTPHTPSRLEAYLSTEAIYLCIYIHWLSSPHESQRLCVDKMKGNREEQIFGAYVIKEVKPYRLMLCTSSWTIVTQADLHQRNVDILGAKTDDIPGWLSQSTDIHHA